MIDISSNNNGAYCSTSSSWTYNAYSTTHRCCSNCSHKHVCKHKEYVDEAFKKIQHKEVELEVVCQYYSSDYTYSPTITWGGGVKGESK